MDQKGTYTNATHTVGLLTEERKIMGTSSTSYKTTCTFGHIPEPTHTCGLPLHTLKPSKKSVVPYTQHRRDGKALGKPGDEPLGANGHQLNVQPIQLLKGFVGRMAMARSWICCMVSSHECDMGTSFKTHPGVA